MFWASQAQNWPPRSANGISMSQHIPIINLAGDPPEVAEQIRRACEEIGFFTIVGHGISLELRRSVQAEAQQFFDLPQAEKKKAQAAPGVGYMPFQEETLAATLDQKTPSDLKETLNLHLPVDPASWPADLTPVAKQYFDALLDLSHRLMRLFARALDLPEEFFDDKTDRPNVILRLINYPPVGEAQPGQMGAGEHTDYGTLTILWSEHSRGLQVRTRDGEWLDVEAEPESFIINIGDLMSNWTNDRWVSTLHRVTPRVNQGRRQSMAFFHNPNPDALIECLPGCFDDAHPPKYAPILAGDHLRRKFEKSVGK
jgi:isopenicillin N synthase-like dioxygenase